MLLNLVGNAIKFTETGEVVVDANWGAGILRLSVRDTGAGIPPESLARVFEPFQRGVGARVTGTGLGLAITRKLVELMGGTIKAGPAPRGGTTFDVCIPAALARSAATPQQEPAPQSALAPLLGRILVAEDNKNLRDLVELNLHELGARVPARRRRL